MDDKLVRQVFEELLPSLEALDTKCAVILQFLKNKGIASDDELAPYFEQAGNASSVRWRAARVRINHLLTSPQASEKDKESSSSEASEKNSEPSVAKQSTEAEAGKAEKGRSDAQKNTHDAQVNAVSNIENQRNGDQEESQSAEREQKDRQPLEHEDKDAA
jgi:hypothetical protein